MEWTKTEDELPGTYEDCLCYVKGERVLGYLSYQEKWIPLSNDWITMTGYEEMPVTHWMYLPKTPNDVKN